MERELQFSVSSCQSNLLLRLAFACLGFAAALAAPARAQAEREHNLWPVRVSQLDASGATLSWQGAGPLIFRQPMEDGVTGDGFRPFYLRKRDGSGALTETSFLYPVFVYRADGESYRWSVVQLINFTHPKEGAPTERNDAGFDVWPFYFSRRTDSPETTYHALFPVFGTMKQRLFNDRISWVLFPAYFRTERRGVVSSFYPWPFLRTIHGDGNSGFALWPLFGWRSKPGSDRSEYYLWPLIYNSVTHLDEPVPKHSFGVLPFYASEHSADAVGETYVWPFFGYEHRTAPYHYDETRYFWPLFLQGRGDRYYNRWAPFYTHSIVNGVDKTWVIWPLFRQQTWAEENIVQTRTQFFFFLYWSLVQRRANHPEVAPASKTHVWPFVSIWDNGAGRRQLQVLSPIEVFFPHNDNMRVLWSPLFALYRYDRSAPGTVRQSVLFDLVTWRREPERHEFHLGPIVRVVSTAASGRITLFGGLLGFNRSAAGSRWRPFWFDFSARD
ncbi:MAG TPA: hypothetical protein VG838_01830 [Opitutaceae bacterium]|nr:hypothetical protein [Opitutaceae bacterium]